MPKSKSENTISYAALNAELEECMQNLQQPGADIDDALKHYERALALIAELEAYLGRAENRIHEMQFHKGEAA